MIVIAMPDEMALVGETEEPVLITGCGINVVKALANIPKDTMIHNIGYAGSNCIPKGTRCSIGRVKTYHPNAKFGERTYVLDGNTVCYTAGDFVANTDIKEPCVFDMELAYILAMGFTNVTAEKIVSDNLSKEEYDEWMKAQ